MQACRALLLSTFLFLIAAPGFAALDGYQFTSPYYSLELTTTPLRIQDLRWDLKGEGNYKRLIVPEMQGLKWASTLYVGDGFFTDTLAGNVGSVEWPAANEILLKDIALIPNLTADWHFWFYDDYFEHEVTFIASQPVSGIYDLGHQWASHRLSHGGDENGETLFGDQSEFGDYATLREEEYVFKMDLIEGSTALQANRYFSGAGIVWQNLFSGGSASLTAGNHPGGKWRCAMVAPSTLGLAYDDFSIGYFEHEGKYVKDFFFLKDAGLWHLIYNIGEAGPTQDWQDAGNEKMFGHATSADLKNWTILDPILPVIPNSWEGQVVSAPSILYAEGQWQLIYTGFDDRYFGLQQVGLAQSPDLVNWTRRPENPLYQGPAWTDWTNNTWANCRDADIMEANGYYYIYTMVTRAGDHKGAIAIARSSDLINWTDLGPAVVLDSGTPESPVVFERKGTYYLITTSNAPACFKSTDPEANGWEQIPFEFPSNTGFWSGFEIFKDGEDYVAAIFRWTTYGNYIRFWRLEWDGDRPWVRYTTEPPNSAEPHWELLD